MAKWTGKVESDQSEDDVSEINTDGSDPDYEAEEMSRNIALNKLVEESEINWEQDYCAPLCKHSDEEEQQEQGSTSSRGGGRGSSKPGVFTSTPDERWNDVDVPDITPPQPTFAPTNPPGPQLDQTATYTVLELFQLFFTNSVLQTIIQNTNDFGSTHHSTPSKPWIDLTLQDMFSYLSVIIYMGLVKCSALTDYWRGGKLYSFPFTKRFMTGKKFFSISRALRLSSMADDEANKQRIGTEAFDCLSKIKPLYHEIREACKRNYHPDQEIAIDARTVHIGGKQYLKNEPVRGGYKVFVLVDSKSGYMWDFFVYEGKLQGSSGLGLGYESVMKLVDTPLLGTGYKLFVDHLYSSPALFLVLLHKKIWACGPILTKRSGCPKKKVNSLDSECASGSIRWIRNDSLLFVQWRDARDVYLCSTFHTAHAQDTVQRRVKGADQRWILKDIPVPPAVKEYNQCMGGVALSDTLMGNYNLNRKTQSWYKAFFHYFLDIAMVNAFLLHTDIATVEGQVPLTQKAFRETLAEELAEVGCHTGRAKVPSAPPTAHHRLVHISGDSTAGRLKCRNCGAKTPVKCYTCDMALCFVPKRDCYNDWHAARNIK
ncbi:piggyBac transposable element-derived protein 4-like [Osmerus mordax]|uniref:piggyBac transposable element-derived protein 4-like n=1 Tax=Osmerus mordax TaxID=8014 RepID=UPI00350F4C21